jgi:O-antigen/teichoic acid export membrane protein
MASGILSIVVGIILLPIVLFTVGPAQYGVWLVVLAIATFCFSFDLGVATAVAHFVSRWRDGDKLLSRDSIVSSAQAWSWTASFIAALLYIPASLLYLSSSKAQFLTNNERDTLFVLGLILVFSIGMRQYTAILVGNGLLDKERVLQLWGITFRLVTTLMACLLTKSLIVVAIAEVIALLIPPFGAMIVVWTRTQARPRFKHISVATLRILFRYSIRTFFVGLIGSTILQSGTLILGLLGSAIDVAIYNAAFRVYSSIRQMMRWATDPFRSMYSRFFVSKPEMITRLALTIMHLTLTACVVSSGVLLILSPTLMKFWVGPTLPDETVTTLVQVLLFGLVPLAMHLPFVPILDAAGFPGAYWKLDLTWLLFSSCISIVLYPSLGPVSVAIGLTVPLIFLEPLYVILGIRITGFSVHTWIKQVLLPSSPTIVALAVSLIFAFTTDDDLTSYILGAFFAGATVLTIFIGLRFHPMSSIQQIMETKL